jgi:hypothetical protein
VSASQIFLWATRRKSPVASHNDCSHLFLLETSRTLLFAVSLKVVLVAQSSPHTLNEGIMMSDTSTTIGVVLLLASLPLFAIGFWGAAFWRGRRAKSLKFIAAAGLSFVFGVAIVPTPSGTPEERAAARETQKRETLAAKGKAAAATTLAAYIDTEAPDRVEIIQAIIADHGAAADEVGGYVDCLGDYATTKSAELTVGEVFGWCETERTNAPQKFHGHFNELDAVDLSTDAAVICNDFVLAELRAPSTADFPLLDRTIAYKGRYRYLVRSYVDAQNAFGGTVRTEFFCDAQYNGDPTASERHSPAAWTLHDLSFE